MKYFFEIGYLKPIGLAAVILLISSCLKQKKDTVTQPPVQPPITTVKYDWPAIADSAQMSLGYFYDATSKFYTVSNNSDNWVQYWPTAHTMDVLNDGYIRTNSETFKSKMDDLLIGMKSQNGGTWINHFYDDMEWMALASLRAYKTTGDTKYKGIIDELWPDIQNGWSADLGGGIWWNKDKGSKNAISNSPAAIFAARMYEQFGNTSDLDFSKKVYAWVKTNLFNANGSVYDNIDKNGTVQTSPGWVFTYNEGTFLGAALELYKITGEIQYRDDAVKAANFTIQSLTSNGILKSEGNGDGGLFKGIFIRYLTRLIIEGDLTPNIKKTFADFVKFNGETLWSKGTNKFYPLFGPFWGTPPDSQTDLTTQLSGIMLFEAVAELSRDHLI